MHVLSPSRLSMTKAPTKSRPPCRDPSATPGRSSSPGCFAVDVESCPAGGGPLKIVAAILQRSAIEKILRHLGLPHEVPTAARAPPQPELDFAAGWDSTTRLLAGGRTSAPTDPLQPQLSPYERLPALSYRLPLPGPRPEPARFDSPVPGALGHEVLYPYYPSSSS